ncbi:hypothetical protein OU491_002108 [Enterococcus hirae]|nr:hypothetical protein [Enterococcus hirae]
MKTLKRMIIKIQNSRGIPVKTTGRDFIQLNKNVFEKNHNIQAQIDFLKNEGLYDQVGEFCLLNGGVAIVERLKDGGIAILSQS